MNEVAFLCIGSIKKSLNSSIKNIGRTVSNINHIYEEIYLKYVGDQQTLQYMQY